MFWFSAITVPSPIVSLPMLLGTDCPVIMAVIITTLAETIKVAFYLLGFESFKKIINFFGPRIVISGSPATPLKTFTRWLRIICEAILKRLAKNRWGLILVAAFPSVFFVNLGPLKLALILGSTQSLVKTLIIFFLGDLLFICVYTAILVGGGTLWASRFV